jgi:hypothetical protein
MKRWFLHESMWHKVVGGALLACLALVSAPNAVIAQEPPVLSGYCPFDVQFNFLVDKEKIHEKKGGIEIITGALKLRLVNLETNASLEVNVPGPGWTVPKPDGSTDTYMGPWILAIPEGVLPGFTPRMFLSKGRVVAGLDAAGNYTSMTLHGKVVDLCAALAQ